MSEQFLTTLLARQGIYDKNGSVHAYELLYRDPDPTRSNTDTSFLGDEATSSVITQLFSNMDINTIIGNKRAYINFTYNCLINKIPCLLPKNRIGIEVLESVIVDQRLINSLMSLKEIGYEIILDDFIYNESTAPLIELADVIKIDVLDINKQQIAQQLEPLQRFIGKLIAEKIEDREQFNNCLDLGFDFFQGFFLDKPNLMKGPIITENKSNLLRLFAEFNNENLALERVEEIILQIPRLSYRILRLANSVASYRGKKIDSLLEAIQKLGLQQIQNWLRLFLLSSQNDVVPDLLERTLIRAKMCECLARISGYSNPHQAYTVGILSTLDSFLNEPMESLLGKVQLSELLNEAILYQKGELGKILQVSINYEKSYFKQLEQTEYSNEILTSSYLEAIEHTNSVMNMINK